MSSSKKGVRWGFIFLVFFMFVVSVSLTLTANGRFSRTAFNDPAVWDQDAEVSLDGFMVMDLSDAGEGDLDLASSGSGIFALGTAYAYQLPDRGKNPSLPEELDALSTLPRVESLDLGLELPPSVKANVRLPMLLDEPTGEFGPLPRDLEDFESIILNTTDDGLKLPDDFLTELPGMELPDEDIIFEETGVHWKEHVVKAGETLSDIVMEHGGITVQDVLRANGLKDANRLAAQQILLVPNSSERVDDTLEEVRTRKARVAALREQVEPLKVISYVVATGDSLWSIASSQNIDVDTLVGSNVFKNSSLLHPGVVLRIPNQDGIFYSLKKGDKIETVAKRYQVAVDKIRKVNPTVDLPSLKAGSEIFLPGARPEAVAEAQPAVKKNEAGAGKKNTSSVGKDARSFRWPVMGRINSAFGWRRHPITRRRDFHTGMDIKGSRGTVIRASRAGTVVYAGWMNGYGKVVVVEHAGGQSTLYAHCSSILTRKGAKVSSGANIARVGATGRATGPHLHFEIRNGNTPVNPLKYLK